MVSSTDQMGRTIKLMGKAVRIISLVPSQTELLFDLGLSDEVVGITKFCIHPEEWFRSKTRVGGTKKIDFEEIKNIQPDLIIGNKEENEELQINELMTHYPVWMSDIKTLEDALQMIKQIGKLVDKREKALALIDRIKTNFRTLPPYSSSGLRVAYIIWRNPLIAVGGDTFINTMLKRCGFINVFEKRKRYPEINIMDLQNEKPDLILLSSEPYPFKEKHLKQFQTTSLNSRAMTVEGEMFSWYGSRLVKAPDYFKYLLHQIKNAC